MTCALRSARIVAATTAALVVLVSRPYRGSLLRTGPKTSVRAAWAAGETRWARGGGTLVSRTAGGGPP